MTIEIPEKEPLSIRAGDTITWKKTLSDYPAPTWELFYRLINGSAHYDITSTASGSSHLIEVSSSTTATYKRGEYDLISWVSDGTDRYTLPVYKIDVLPDLAAASQWFDNRSTAKKVLDLLDTALENQGSNAWVNEYTIAGRTMKFRSMGEFLSYRSRIKAEVIKEENQLLIKSGLAPKNKINIRM